jgi:Protein of unknown function (DUF4238)
MSSQPKNLQRNNHYLPACYQEAFTGPDGRVWAKFAGKEPEPRKPSSVGRSRSFYIRNINGVEDDRMESFFGRAVEDRFAGFARRIKLEGNALTSIEPQEQAALLLFIATQAVRTLAHKRCIDTQAGREVARDEFLRAMGKQMWTVADVWGKNPPTLRFFTNLPFVSDQFISGDHPVLVIHLVDNRIWVPTATPEHRITKITDLLNDPSCGFWIALSPYICVSVQPRDGATSYLPPATLEPPQVRMLNDMVANQSRIFTLARDRAPLN